MTPDPKISEAIVDITNNVIATNLRACMKHGVPPLKLVEILLNQACSIIALVDPAGTRAEMTKGAVESIPLLVRDHVNARHRVGSVYVSNPDAA